MCFSPHFITSVQTPLRCMNVGVIVNSKKVLIWDFGGCETQKVHYTDSNWIAVLVVTTVLTCLLHPTVSGCRSQLFKCTFGISERTHIFHFTRNKCSFIKRITSRVLSLPNEVQSDFEWLARSLLEYYY